MKVGTLVLVVAAGLMPVACSSTSGGGARTPERAMSELPDATRQQVDGYLGALGGLVSVLAGVTDTPSASQSMPRLEEYLQKVTQHAKEINGLAPETRRRIGEAFGARFASWNDAYAAQVNRIKGTPGLGQKLGPLLDKVTLLR